MKLFSLFLTLATASMAMKSEFSRFIAMFGKVYKSKEEEQHRFKVFSENLEKIKDHNNAAQGYMMGLN
jgi:hypothetical protein